MQMFAYISANDASLRRASLCVDFCRFTADRTVSGDVRSSVLRKCNVIG
jgi:hypothetical protein